MSDWSVAVAFEGVNAGVGPGQLRSPGAGRRTARLAAPLAGWRGHGQRRVVRPRDVDAQLPGAGGRQVQVVQYCQVGGDRGGGAQPYRPRALLGQPELPSEIFDVPKELRISQQVVE